MIHSVVAIDHKCSACRAVGRELSKTMLLEASASEGKVVDMRGRLDSKGQRYGKKISYKVSELRFIELLEDVCDGEVKRYRVLNEDDGWFLPQSELEKNKVKMKGKLRVDTMKSEIVQYCNRVIEEAEEDLKSGIYDESVNSTNVEAFLCRDTVKACDINVDFTPKDEVIEEPSVDGSAKDESAENATEAQGKTKKRKSKKKSSKKSKKSEL
jgi:hypothetical protein